MDKFWDSNIKFLPGIGDRRAMLIEKELGVVTYRDLITLYPYRYVDRSRIFHISELYNDSLNSYIQIRARIESVQVVGAGSKNRLVARAIDRSGEIELVWFNRIDWISKRLEVGREFLIFGKPQSFNNAISMVHPEVDLLINETQLQSLGIYGVYSSSEKLAKGGVTTKIISTAIRELIKIGYNSILETLPQYIIEEHKLLSRAQALLNIHFPKNHNALNAAQHRLKFEEFMVVQLSILRQRTIRMSRNEGRIFRKIGDNFNNFYFNLLPFPLTEAQKRVIKEIRNDTVTGRQMNRLLQGDVGSGKTIVALISMLIAIDNGYQCCLMAPTDILATQHFESISEMTSELGIKVALLKGSTGKKARRELFESLLSGETNILISTHAVLEENVEFKELGFVVIDEQHRFGVEQRSRLWRKSDTPPHILVMSATPIPRTLAMTIYGDLDVSVIDQLPPGRKPIKTVLYNDSKREMVFGFMRSQIAEGRQIYVVYPMIKESEKMDYSNLEEGYESIIRAFPHEKYVTSIVHGKMKPKDKQLGMDIFTSGTANILLATSVIEVGVNVPNATVMVIESAERFGLSQLHQLRGRVGRGGEQSYCILMSGYKLSADGRKRLEAMTQTTDGFELAELDLKLRGYGDLEGTKQSGDMFDLKIASVAKDNGLLVEMRTICENIVESDPLLQEEKNQKLLELIQSEDKKGKVVDFSSIS